MKNLTYFFLVLITSVTATISEISQAVLSHTNSIPHYSPPGYEFPYQVRQQDGQLCDAGVNQWTGLINVTDDKSIFFWFFESRSKPAEDAVSLWINGGPGATSMGGLFTECGPCSTDGNTSSRNENNTWVNFSNMLYIDQPAGSGLSPNYNESTNVDTLAEGAKHFNIVLHVLFTKIFPGFAYRQLHLAGESFGGHFIPYYTKTIVELQASRSEYRVPMKITSIILVNALVDLADTITGQYDMFCSEKEGENGVGTGFNDTACRAMAAAVPECETLGAKCRETGNRDLCTLASKTCDETVGKWFLSDVKPGGRSPYDNRITCDESLLCSDMGLSAVTEYLNQPQVQHKLGYAKFTFEPINFKLNDRWTEKGDTSISTMSQLSFILDETSIRVLVLNGNNDVVVNTPGQIRIFDNLPWSGQAPYRTRQFHNWEFFDHYSGKQKKGGQMKGYGKLSFVTVDEAGHMSPSYQPAAIMEVVRNWTSGEDLLLLN